ncbi:MULTISPECIES: nitrous oxide reductase accessory protein NosL [Cohaesibacter]|uniref:nitrous oxide reductase accessory protein NosL n=1 Tax=Cohaesibacter TaxID=655352 RepID=UPI000DE8CCB2|nr:MULTISPECIES: nitrous oxide reductase accessory protein NosL [Cohaesibacter]TLP44227.1 nitrous oxide reductase accessory protein NosL [Cohaesibacter sp. CAU 1516]
MCTRPNLTRRSLIAAGLSAPMMLHAAKASASELLFTPFGTPMPHDRDACPVCGMFPARYPDWIATVLYKDGHADHFDGAKDLFKYLLDMDKYASGRKREDILHVGVTDYYAIERIDARKALYVIGSDILGPMGHELVPHPDRYDADEFMKDHQGKRILTFGDVTMDLLLGLDNGEFRLK